MSKRCILAVVPGVGLGLTSVAIAWLVARAGLVADTSADELPPPPAATEPPGYEARLGDGGTMRLHVKTERLELVTPYGTLDIPVSHIRRLEVGWRLAEGEQQRIDALIAELGHEEFDHREVAMLELARLGERAHTALEQASKSQDLEIACRSTKLLEALREVVPPERLQRSHLDVVHTADSVIAGRLNAASLRVATAQFGELQLRLADLRELRPPGAEESEPLNAIPDPGNLANYQNQVGAVLAIRITGATQVKGSVWGTDVYTLDSNLAMASVHAGILKPGQTKAVRVRILGPTNGFLGSSRNGITSQSFGSYPAAYELVKSNRR